MPTECSRDLFGFATVEGREVVAAFNGGAITSDAGALLLSLSKHGSDRSGDQDDGTVCGVLLRCTAPGPDRA
jgi:hypothetical protein